MAGHRRKTRRPRRSDARLANRRARLRQRLREADGPLDRLRIAVDHLISVLLRLPERERNQIAEQHTHVVLELAARLTRRRGSE